MDNARPELWVCHLGTVDYRAALGLQERIRTARQEDLVPDVLLTLEHWPVYTRGRRSDPAELPMGEDWYLMQGIEIVDTNRGGKVTYHGPGQLVGYPIVGVQDVVAYVRTLEQALVTALHEEGIRARARPQDGPDFTGVWVEDRKIASIGVHTQRGVTTHGFAVNVENDLQPFGYIVACGLDGVQMTSVIKETRRKPNDSGAAPTDEAGTAAEACGARAGRRPEGQLSCFRKRAAYQVAQALGRRQRLISLARLEAAVGRAPGAGAAQAGLARSATE